jgi:thiamine-phosphate pyrophosphorylase
VRTKALYQCHVSDKFLRQAGFNPGLYAIADDSVAPDQLLVDKVRLLLEAKVPVIQLRLKNTSRQGAFEAAQDVVQLAKGSGTKILINDSVEIALCTGVDGVHLGADDLPIWVARSLLRDKIVGATCRTLVELETAAQQGADYGGLGPVFSSTTKALAVAPLGLLAAFDMAQRSPIPVVAIGGLRLEHVPALAKSAVYSMAVVSDLWRDDNVVSRAQAFLRAWSTA